jgi:hypothetical protein
VLLLYFAWVLLTDCLTRTISTLGFVEVKLGVTNNNIRFEVGNLQIFLVLAFYDVSLYGEISLHVLCNLQIITNK